MTETRYDLISEDYMDHLLKTYPYNILASMGFDKNELEYFPLKHIKLEMEKTLDERELKILEFRYKDKLSFKDIGEKLNISSGRVSEICHKAARRLCSHDHKKNMRLVPYSELEALEDKINNLLKEIDRLKEQLYAENSLLDTNISHIGLSVRAYNCLRCYSRYPVVTVKDMADFVNNNFESVLKVRYLGRKTLKEILTFLDDNKLLINDEARRYLL